MIKHDAVIAVFPDHAAAESAVKKLTAGGVPMQSLSIAGRGCHTEEHVAGFYDIGGRVKFWGSRGAFRGGSRSLFFGGMFPTTSLVGLVTVLVYLAVALVSALEGSIVVGSLIALGAALASIGVLKNRVAGYKMAVGADSFLVMAHGPPDEVSHAIAILDDTGHMPFDPMQRRWRLTGS